MSADLVRGTRWLALASLAMMLVACSWFTDFKEQPKHDPWETAADSVPMRGNPQSSVPVYGSAAPGFAVSRLPMPATVDSMSSLANPVPADERSLHNGRMYYQINCAVCHGESGKGFQEGPAGKYGIYAPPISTGNAVNLTDGYIWGIIRNGRGGMPSYNRIEELDRWDVVNYVRGLQGRYAVAVGPVGLPGETGNKVPGYSQTGPTRPSPWYIRTGSQAGPSRGFTPAAAAPARADSAAHAAPLPATPTDTTTHTPGGER